MFLNLNRQAASKIVYDPYSPRQKGRLLTMLKNDPKINFAHQTVKISENQKLNNKFGRPIVRH